MIESIFNINFAIIDFLNDNNVDSVDKYSETEDIKKSNELIKALLKDEIPKDEETNTIEEIIKLNPYNENIYKALLYKYGDEENQIEHLGEFLGYNNIHEYNHNRSALRILPVLLFLLLLQLSLYPSHAPFQ